MYRDSSAALDEHDRAVGAILIGEALVEECERAATKVKRPETSNDHERWRAVHSVNDTYPEVWRHLDRARRVLAKRGANTVGYDAQQIDGDALDAAKRAIAELKLAVPGADWDAIAARTDGLVHAPLGAKRDRARYAVGAVIAAFVFAVVAWFLSIVPEHKPTHAETMRRELRSVAAERKARIDFLSAELGDRCLTPTARELVQDLVQDGRGPEAKGVGERYLARCGYDTSIDHWSHAPPPGR
jgi:hypothetical protein